MCGTGGLLPPAPTGDWPSKLQTARRDDNREAWEAALEALFCAPGFRAKSPETFRQLAGAAWIKPLAKGRWDSRIAPVSGYWGQFEAPARLIYGVHDKNGTPANARDLEARLNARLTMFPDAGHFVVREKQDEVVDIILQFANSLAN